MTRLFSALIQKLVELGFGGILVLTGSHLFSNLVLTLMSEERYEGSGLAFGIFAVTFVAWYALFGFQAPPPPQFPREAPSFAKVQIPLRTRFQVVLLVVLAICAVVLLGAGIAYYLGFPVWGWVTRDALIGGAVAFLFWLTTQSYYVVDPAQKEIYYQYSNLFLREIRRIPFQEVAAVTLTGRLSGWPLLFKLYAIEFTLVLVFKNGTILPVYEPLSCRDHVFEHYHHMENLARRLARVLNRPFFLGAFSRDNEFSDWSRELRRLVSQSDRPQALERTLWDVGMAGMSFELLEPGVIKVDLPTLLEKTVLACITLVFAGATVFFLVREWNTLLQNPRLIYLILLDSGSVLVTILAVWRLLIDEYYVFDLSRQVIRFSSRLLFFRREYDLVAFKDVEFAALDKREFGNKCEYAAYLGLARDERLYLSDFVLLRGVPLFRAHAIARVLGCYLGAVKQWP